MTDAVNLFGDLDDLGLDELESVEDTPVSASGTLQPVTGIDIRTIKAQTRPWLYADLLLKGGVSVLVSPGGVGKSLFALTVLIGIAIGRDLLKLTHLDKPRKVLLLNNEDPTNELELRLLAVGQAFDLTDAELDLIQENFAYQSGFHESLRLVALNEQGGPVPSQVTRDMVTYCRSNGVEVVVCDPLVSLHELSENDNTGMEAVAAIIRNCGADAGAAIMLLHHTRKDGGGNTPDVSARGATAIVNAARVNFGLMRMTEKVAGEYELPVGDWVNYVGLVRGKQNYSQPTGTVHWLELVSVSVPAEHWETGATAVEPVGVLREAQLYAKVQQTKGWSLHRVMTTILEAGIPSGFTLADPGTAEQLGTLLSDNPKKPLKKTTLNERFKDVPERTQALSTAGVGVVVGKHLVTVWAAKDTHNQNRKHYYYEAVVHELAAALSTTGMVLTDE